MAPYMYNPTVLPHTNTRYNQSVGQQTQTLNDIQLHKLPQSSSEYSYKFKEQQPSGNGILDSDPYLVGFLDGIAATNAKYIETLLPHSTNLRRCDYVYSSLLPQEFSSEEPLPDGSSIQSILLSVAPLPDIRNSSFGSAPLLSLENPHPPLLPEQILLHGVSATSLVSQPPLATDQSVCPGPFGFSCNESYPSDFQPFPERAYEGHDTTLAGFLANGDQIPNDLYLCVRPKTQLDSLPHTSAPISSNAWSPNVENPHEPELSSYGSSQGIQGFKRQITLPVSPPPVKAKRKTKCGAYGVFRVEGTKRRSKFNQQARLGTALTRSIGACATCQKKKLRCNMRLSANFVPCGRCASTSPNLLRGPCCRIDLMDIKLFRLGSTENPEFLRRWTLSKEPQKGLHLLEDETIVFEPPRRVFLTQDINRTSFVVSVSRFQPGPDDATAFIAGSEKYELPPYYISDMDEARQNIQRYIHEARREYTAALLKNRTPIMRKTFEEAERYLKESKSELVSTALTFWSATRLIERTWLICGEDLLGLPPMQDNFGPCLRNSSMDAVPATPLMDTQLDELAIGTVLIPMGKKVLRLLKERTLARKREHWYEIYLATFIILSSFEQILADVVDFSERVGMVSSPKTNSGPSLSDGYYHACKVILVYFHFASGGATPLSLDWQYSKQDASKLSQQQMAYLRSMQQEMLRQDFELKALKDASMYGTELYWCHQMLYPGWKADTPHCGDFLGFTEKDFMCS